ncbi:hypothetical protein C1645_834436 [Glomus cerebriforme]|uniref:Serine-threonine/tyrosine-protein kinase catalytic domain-containing protein n=1 Tax=Glomus cerebriforme TaxID=658196 RepID=A0A397SFL5_9GLOM|nr:hypothetical protein C1645_834436 [Glomus cerebriforme]
MLCKLFQQSFKISGNNDIDKFIRDTQLLAHHSETDDFQLNKNYKILEWIPYDFMTCKRRKFMNENIIKLYGITQDPETKNYMMNIIKLYGITQDPETKNYMMVLDYAKNGNLRNYLDTYYNKLSWEDKIEYCTDRINSHSDISSISLSYKTHSEAIYTSRLLDFTNLPDRQSVPLQIDILQLKSRKNIRNIKD